MPLKLNVPLPDPCEQCGRRVCATVEEVFWSWVDRTGGVKSCWLWMGYLDESGRGRFNVYDPFTRHTKNLVAPRQAWQYLRGAIPDGMVVCHNCPGGDNPQCCNPSHCFLGTIADNLRDAVKKEWVQKGDAHWSRRVPERVARGEKSGPKAHPERMARGEQHGLHLHPEAAARGERNGVNTHPEALQRGDDHWSRRNPERLVEATRMRRGRLKLSPQQVQQIRDLRASGSTQAALARQFQVSAATISNIMLGKRWRPL